MSRRRGDKPPGEILEVAPDELRQAVERMHGCRAKLLEVATISESFEGQPVWSGLIHVFDLEGHPKASLCRGRHGVQ